jgi:S1/P1 Nuclease
MEDGLMKRIVVAAALFLASLTPAASWSEDGHRIVCAIAWKELSAEARTAIERLLEDDPAASFPEACVWADAIRGNPA